jgi:hypothetical protein
MSSKIKKCEKIDRLIQRKATGSPKELARKIGVSETYVKRLISFMKQEYNMPISYSAARGYIYEGRGKFFVGWIEEK